MKHWWKIDEKVWCVFFPHWFFQDWWKIDEKLMKTFSHTHYYPLQALPSLTPTPTSSPLTSLSSSLSSSSYSSPSLFILSLSSSPSSRSASKKCLRKLTGKHVQSYFLGFNISRSEDFCDIPHTKHRNICVDELRNLLLIRYFKRAYLRYNHLSVSVSVYQYHSHRKQ